MSSGASFSSDEVGRGVRGLITRCDLRYRIPPTTTAQPETVFRDVILGCLGDPYDYLRLNQADWGASMSPDTPAAQRRSLSEATD
jgi:hypothetical protein